eukprot:gnl/TRDRNA2_/TRDRNA2_129918_c0_seq4.p1 gnl/TRDRNA2_/TRDRNA2_129918_c0~~gnl/TRDRNA2_/TRDRNA2_129918_c0_seq4.p1  ORF type:complete len:201 (+),score=72.99 gnl/TRDRNA2_/TRDRNA2_129918_c0_seq4:93-695(+)
MALFKVFVATAALVSLVAGRLLAPPALSIDEQIAALNAQITATQAKVVHAKEAANMTVDDSDFKHHCKPEVKAKLDKEVDEAPEKEATEKVEPKIAAFADELEATNRQSMIKNEEFLLGLLIMHQTRGNWIYEQELDAICSMAEESPMIKRLYKHHDKNKSLAAQLAQMMDDERKAMPPTKAPPMKLEGDSVASILAKVR